jgi:hypothetical protein
MAKLLLKSILLIISPIVAYFVLILGTLLFVLITNTVDGLQRGHTSPVHYLIPFYELGDVLIPFTHPRIFINTIPYLFEPYNLIGTWLWVLTTILAYWYLTKKYIK